MIKKLSEFIALYWQFPRRCQGNYWWAEGIWTVFQSLFPW